MSEPDPRLVAVVERAAALLTELYEPAGILIYWSARISYLDGKRPCDLYAEGDVEALTHMCNRLDAFADGAFL
jgi:hypothetical protein